MSKLSNLRTAYMRNPNSKTLHAYLLAKARAGRFDKRMCRYYGVNPKVNRGCRKAIARAYAAGLVPTSTTGGAHSPSSYHFRFSSLGEGMAVDFGLRRKLIGTRRGQRRLNTFHRKEYWRALVGKIRPLELIGPHNDKNILGGVRIKLREGSLLEEMHDNHIHEAYPNG